MVPLSGHVHANVPYIQTNQERKLSSTIEATLGRKPRRFSYGRSVPPWRPRRHTVPPRSALGLWIPPNATSLMARTGTNKHWTATFLALPQRPSLAKLHPTYDSGVKLYSHRQAELYLCPMVGYVQHLPLSSLLLSELGCHVMLVSLFPKRPVTPQGQVAGRSFPTLTWCAFLSSYLSALTLPFNESVWGIMGHLRGSLVHSWLKDYHPTILEHAT